MTSAANPVSRAVVPVAVGVLVGFIAGYFAGGAGRPAVAGNEAPAVPGGSDRIAQVSSELDKDPENPRLLNGLGNLYSDRDDWDRAIAAYEKARRKAPRDPNLLSDLGVAYRNRGEFKRAESLFNKAREADPDHWQSLVNLTLLAAFDTRDGKAAKRHLEELKRRFPGIPNLEGVEKQIAALSAKS
ncbi:MAG: tetratricopeptide repeat protein [Thermoanaerobaculia bacterium]